MIFKQKPAAAAVSMALWSLAIPAIAQTQDSTQMQTVEVTGIRASLAKSLNVKKNASANVEVITAEDVGKMPDKNLADSLQRLAGVAVRTDYDEAEKVSMRGTNPDMSLILFNGHTVSGGDWYVADQGSSSRSTSLSLMPSSVLNQAVVYKTPQANLADGGLAGTINVTTRKPLSQKEKFSGAITLGATYAQLPGKTTPDLNANATWQNDAGTMGVIVQGFKEKRYNRRDSVSRFAYGASSGWDVINTATMKGITDASLAGTGLKAADLNGVRLPGSMSSEFVEGERDRKGGMMSIQFKPSQDLDITATGFYSSMNANNHGRLTAGAIYSMLLGKNDPLGGVTAAAANTSSNGQQVFAQIRNPVIVNETTIYGNQLKVLKSADIVFPAGTTPQYVGNSEGFYRDGANATSSFLDLDAKYRVDNALTVKGLASVTRGEGKTMRDQGLTFARYGTGISYGLNGIDNPPDSQYIGAGANAPVLNPDGSGYRLVGFAASGIRTVDREHSLQLDAEYKLDKGWLQSIESGVRYADHKRTSGRYNPALRGGLPAAPSAGVMPYPPNFGSGLGDSNWDNTGFTYSPETLKAYISAITKDTTPEFERRVASEIDMRERQEAVYLMANLEADKWSGNVGVRFVRTIVDAELATPIPANICQRTEPGKPAVACAAYPTAITTAGDGASYQDNLPFNPNNGVLYYKTPTHRTFSNVLPSLNLRYEFDKDMLARFGASRTLGRQNYNVLGASFGTPSCNANGCTVTGPNPNLKPLTSDNLDLSWSWFFRPRSLIAVDLFHSKIDGYVKTGTVSQTTIDLVDPRDQTVKPFFVNTSSQQGAKIDGVEVSYEQPLWGSFGIQTNVSRARTRVDDGRPMVGASEWAANVGGYFENDLLSARLVYNYRGKYVNSSTAPAPTANSQGLSVINGVAMPTAPTIAAGVGTLAFSLNYNLSKKLMVSLDATNLLDTKRAQYRYSEEEPQKLDVSGRQFYLNLKYKF
ncbi:MAG: TonB-dependent receptor [Massilia sp.]|nr:TonB-dependent receptor [Massilia sp.]